MANGHEPFGVPDPRIGIAFMMDRFGEIQKGPQRDTWAAYWRALRELQEEGHVTPDMLGAMVVQLLTVQYEREHGRPDIGPIVVGGKR
jgi:hypothetical protein